MTNSRRPSDPGSLDAAGGGISERFLAAVRAAVDRAAVERAAADQTAVDTNPDVSEEVEMLPARLAAAAREVLHADGAGLSLFGDDFRLPLGASDPQASVAEALQFTLGNGPCWQANRHDIPIAVDEADIAAMWPQFHHDLVHRTRFRSVASTPIRFARVTGGALDVYFVDDTAARHLDPDHAVVVAAHIAAILNRASAEDPTDDPRGPLHGQDHDAPSRDGDGWGKPGPRWTRGQVAEHRNAVWIAAGMLIGDDVTDISDAVALLRAHGFSTGRTVDAVAADLVTRTLDPTEVTGPGLIGR